MAKVSCEVYGCTYNCDGGCRLESIRIEGAHAEKACDTVCESYTDRTEKGYVNCTPADCACGACSIECDAQGLQAQHFQALYRARHHRFRQRQ